MRVHIVLAAGPGYGDGEKETLGLSALNFDKGCGRAGGIRLLLFPHRALTAFFAPRLFDLAETGNFIEPY